jgi:hypothetical protein
MAVKTVVNLLQQSIPLTLKLPTDVKKTEVKKIGPRASMEIDEGLFTSQVTALIRQKRIKIRVPRIRKGGK